jgi:hypothetical protein
MISTDNSNVDCAAAFEHVLDWWYEEHCVCARGHIAVSTMPVAQAANLIGTGFNPVMVITAFAELKVLTGSNGVPQSQFAWQWCCLLAVLLVGVF